MEGESLFNDSSSIVLFKIFFDMVKRLAQGKPGSQLGMGAEALDIAGNIVWLTVGASRPFSPLTRPASFMVSLPCVRHNAAMYTMRLAMGKLGSQLGMGA